MHLAVSQIADGLIFLYRIFREDVRQTLASEPHVSADDYLVIPSWLRMVQVVGAVVEFRDISQIVLIQGPDNEGIPSLKYYSTGLSVASLLKLFRSGYAVLAINNHESAILDLLPLLWLLKQQPIF